MPLDRDNYRNKCKYFNGTVSQKCEAGVCYRTLVGGEDAGWILRLPCNPFTRKRAAEQGVVPSVCDQFTPYTEADIDALEAEFEVSYDRHRKAAPLCARIRAENKGKTARGSDSCPACGTGTLHWSISGYNGHMHGRCSTPGCLNWME